MATNQDIRKAVQDGGFRRDLYYRLQTHHIHVPPLRERPEDLNILIEHYLQQACREYEKSIPDIPGSLFAMLGRYAFPGNVRELRSMIFDAVSRHKTGKLSLDTFESALGTGSELAGRSPEQEVPLTLGARFPTLKQATTFLIEEALARTGGNQAKAAKLLGITPPALSRRLSRSGD